MTSRLLVSAVLGLACVVTCFGQTEQSEVRKVTANGAVFHFIEKGDDDRPVIVFLHGGIGDYRAWNTRLQDFSARYRVISYSRRFYYPNQNPRPKAQFSVFTEADDLYAFLQELKLKRVRLVGASMGAFVALVFTLDHPEMVESLVLGEPPVLQLVRSTPGGETVYKKFLTELDPVKREFKHGDDRAAVRAFLEAMGRRWQDMSPRDFDEIMKNARGLKEVNLAVDPFPLIASQRLRKMKVRTLVITGDRTMEINRLVDERLVKLIPGAKLVVIPNSGHQHQRDNPVEYSKVVLEFIDSDTQAK